MTPAQWTTFWELLIFAAVGTFSLLAIYVAIGGIADIRSMLHHMHPDNEQPPSEP